MAGLWEIGGALLGGLLSGDDEKSTSEDRSPWGPAQPWMQSNIVSGQELQKRYQQNPFSQPQLDAYGRAFDQSNQFRNTSNSLMQQMTAQPQFDRSAPLTRPNPYNFGGSAGAGAGGPGGGSGMGPFSFSYEAPTAAINQALQQQQQANVYDGNWGGGDQGGNGPGGGGGGLGLSGNGAFAFGSNAQGLMNGPLGIGIGQIGNMLDAWGITNAGHNPANVSVTDAYGRTPAAIQGLAAQYGQYNNPNAGMGGGGGGSAGDSGGFGGYGGDGTGGYGTDR